MIDSLATGPSGYQYRSLDTTAEMQSLLLPKAEQTQRFFTGQHLHPRQLRPEPFHRLQPDWVPLLLLFCFVLLAWVNVFDRLRLQQVVKAPFAKRFLNQLTREGDLFTERISLALGTVYTLSYILLLYLFFTWKVSANIPFGMHPVTFYLVIGGGLLLFWSVKVFLIRLLGTVFKTHATTREYLLNIMIFNLIAGILLLPVLVLAIYLQSPFFLYTGLIIISLMYVFRFFRGFIIGISLTKFSYLFLFVYLCSLEFLPLVVLLKLFLTYYHSAVQIN
jgi:hypothetical protein